MKPTFPGSWPESSLNSPIDNVDASDYSTNMETQSGWIEKREQQRKSDADDLRQRSKKAEKCSVCGSKMLFGPHTLCEREARR